MVSEQGLVSVIEIPLGSEGAHGLIFFAFVFLCA
jgi:hypothetical protein